MSVLAASAERALPLELIRVAARIRDSRAVVLTGAGMSTASGIPDYRGPDGQRRVTPMQYAEFVASSTARQRYWARSFVGWQRFTEAVPNDGHRAVTRLQGAGHLGAVITQNVDGLHQGAGTRDVTELHGALADVVCLTCGDRSTRQALDERMREANPAYVVDTAEIRPDGDVSLEQIDVDRFIAPTCLICGRDTLKPDVVFFGESVPKSRVERCFALTEQAEVFLVLGSSLAVMSGLRFVRRAAARGIPVIIITRLLARGAELATERLDSDLPKTLGNLVDILDA
ncbi:MAG: Sir2 family NAD-dependent protein deacetylase [Actinomycetia bacterium]|nr:Sir2 family NAD-dependent protein deacetylase [Actinomycetes bacterium]